MNRGCVVLCGGKSRRMGVPKATLPFGPEMMVQRVLRLLRDIAPIQVVVLAPDQEVPPLPDHVRVARDARSDRGPLEGLLAGLAALEGTAESFYASSCDVPLVRPAFVEALFQRLRPDVDIVVPRDDRHYHPLAAVYRVRIADAIRNLLVQDRLRPAFLFESCRTVEVPVAQLRVYDPELDSLRNLNHPRDYVAALERAGFPVPEAVRALLGPQTD